MAYVILMRDRLDNKQFVGPFDAVGDAETWLANTQHHFAVVYPLMPPTSAVTEPGLVKKTQREFHFGKYKGHSIESILASNPQYIRWAYDNVEGHAGLTADDYRKAGGSLPDPLPKTLLHPLADNHRDSYHDDDIPF